MPLAQRHEHDHAPVPARHGGTQTFCVCVNCHDLKDRTPLSLLDASAWKAMQRWWGNATPIERIVYMKMYAVVLDAMEVLAKDAFAS